MRTNLSIPSGAADCRCRKLAVQVPTQDESENDPDIKDVLQSAQSIPETVPVVTNHTNVGGPSDILLGGVGHCFPWHVRVSLGFYLNFKTDKLVHSGLCAT
jgi:hypothetical protein